MSRDHKTVQLLEKVRILRVVKLPSCRASSSLENIRDVLQRLLNENFPISANFRCVDLLSL